MSKTAQIPDDVHTLIIDKQIELKRRHRVSVKISDIIAIVMKNNIHKVGEYLGLVNKEEKDIKQDIKQDITDDTKQNVIEETEIKA